jgi:hypothetical protein
LNNKFGISGTFSEVTALEIGDFYSLMLAERIDKNWHFIHDSLPVVIFADEIFSLFEGKSVAVCDHNISSGFCGEYIIREGILYRIHAPLISLFD